MANPYPAVFRDDNADTRLAGVVDFTDAGNQPGSTAPITREQINGLDVTIADGASASLTWDTKTFGDSLLVLTAPSAPVVVTAGVYSFAVLVQVSAPFTAGGGARIALQPDVNGEDPEIQQSLTAAAGKTAFGTVTMTYYCAAGAVIDCSVLNQDGAASRDFGLSAIVQRIS